jgi:hypothetical protein
MYIWLLHTDTDYGPELGAYSTEEKAKAALLDFVDLQMQGIEDSEIPDDPQERIAEYFSSDGRTWFIERVTLDE